MTPHSTRIPVTAAPVLAAVDNPCFAFEPVRPGTNPQNKQMEQDNEYASKLLGMTFSLKTMKTFTSTDPL